MKVSELGELGLIKCIAEVVNATRDTKAESWRQLVLGIGDDAAAWKVSDSIQLSTLDSLVQGVHFTLDTANWAELGWKALAINLSDIAAMGGSPRYALVSLALPGNVDVDDVISFYKGILELAGRFEVAIVGGDTDNGPQVSITVTLMGTVRSQDSLLRRDAAKVGDKVAVTGYLGGAAGGLEMLTKHLHFSDEATRFLRRSFLQPNPRVLEGQLLVKHGVKAATDISDGLVADLGHICRSSRVGARIEANLVPMAPAVTANFGDNALEMALSGGEDYELLFTAPVEVVSWVKSTISCPVTVIGEITAYKPGQVSVVDSKGSPVKISRPGWEHFTLGNGTAEIIYQPIPLPPSTKGRGTMGEGLP